MAFALEERRMQRQDSRRADTEKLDRLTSREREVLEHAARGLHAKEIAVALGISPPYRRSAQDTHHGKT